MGLLIILSLSACGNKTGEYLAPNLAPEDVVSAAQEFLSASNINVAAHQLRTLGFDYVTRDWHINLEWESGGLHDYYWVVIQDDNIDKNVLSGR